MYVMIYNLDNIGVSCDDSMTPQAWPIIRYGKLRYGHDA